MSGDGLDTAGGTLTLINQSATLGNGVEPGFTALTIDGGTLDLASYDVTVATASFLDYGTIAGPGTLAVTGSLLLNTLSNGFDILGGATLIDLGTIDQTNGQLYLDGELDIGAGAAYTLSVDTGKGPSPYSSVNQNGAATVNNAGLIYSTGFNGIYSANPNFIDAALDSTGTIYADTGSVLQLRDGGTLSGTLTGPGTIAIEDAPITTSSNLLIAGGKFINDALIDIATNSTVVITGAVGVGPDNRGESEWQLEAGATLDAEGSLSGQIVSFDSASAELIIGTASGGFGFIDLFGIGDTIDLEHIQANSYTYDSTQEKLTLLETQSGSTTVVDQIYLRDVEGDRLLYGNGIALSSDGHGGTDIVQDTPSITSSSWLGGSDLWKTAADWSAGIPNSKTIGAVIDVSGTYTITLAAGTAETVDGVTQNAANSTLDVLGKLNLSGTHQVEEYDSSGQLIEVTEAGSSYDLYQGAATLAASGAINGYGMQVGSEGSNVGTASLLLAGASAAVAGVFIDHTGTILATGNATLSGVLENDGTIVAEAGANLALTGISDPNLVRGVLSTGAYEAEGGTISLSGGTIIDDYANIVLFGTASKILAGRSAVNIESSLIDVAGTLQILGGRDYVTANTLTDSGVIILDGTLSDSWLSITSGRLEGSGEVDGHIHNAGTVLDTGSLLVAGGVTGRGIFSIAAGADLNLAGPVANGLTVAFAGAGATLAIGDPRTEHALLAGLTISDVIDITRGPVTGVMLSGSELVITLASGSIVTETLAGTFNGEGFAIVSDGAKGSDLTLTSAPPIMPGTALALAPMGFIHTTTAQPDS